jgi:hypothetical protein
LRLNEAFGIIAIVHGINFQNSDQPACIICETVTP